MIVLGILTAALAFTAIWNGWIGYMPPVEDLQNPINRFATQIYSADETSLWQTSMPPLQSLWDVASASFMSSCPTRQAT